MTPSLVQTAHRCHQKAVRSRGNFTAWLHDTRESRQRGCLAEAQAHACLALRDMLFRVTYPPKLVTGKREGNDKNEMRKILPIILDGASSTFRSIRIAGRIRPLRCKATFASKRQEVRFQKLRDARMLAGGQLPSFYLSNSSTFEAPRIRFQMRKQSSVFGCCKEQAG